MKTRTKIATVVLVVLLSATAFGLYRTAKPFVALRAILAPLGTMQAQTMVDQTPLTTAQNLAQLSNSRAEQKFAQEALRLGDHEVDLTFAAALREVTEHPPALSPEAKKIQDRLARSEKALDTDNVQVAQLTEAAGKASGAKKDQLTNQWNLAKSQQELDQDEVDDAKQDLIRAGGDPQARILALEKDLQLTAARQAAESAVGSITLLHNALESRVDTENTNAPAPAGEALAGQAASHGATPGPTNQNAGDASDVVTTTKKRAADRRALSSYDKRIDDEKQLAQVYDNWQLLVGAKQRAVIHRMLINVAVILGILVFGLFFDDWFERLLGKTALDRRQVETLRTVTRVTLQIGRASCRER